MDEWTKEDVAKMEAEAEKEIEVNFPSYFDEVQKTFFAGTFLKDGRKGGQRNKGQEIDIEHIFSEFMEVTRSEEPSFRSGVLKNRLEVIEQGIQLDKFE